MDSRDAAAAFDAIKPVEKEVPSTRGEQTAEPTAQAAPVGPPIKHKRKRINVATGQWEEIEVELPPGTDTRNPVVDLNKLEPPTEADVAAGRVSAEVAAEMRRAKEIRDAAEAAAAKAAPAVEPSARGEQMATIEMEDDPDAEDPEAEEEPEEEPEQEAAPAPKQLAAAPTSVQPQVQALPAAPPPAPGTPHPDDEKLIAAMKQWCTANGVNSSLMVSPVRSYLRYLREQKLTLAAAPADTANKLLLSRFEKPSSRNVVGNNLLRGLTVLRELGLTVSQQIRMNEKIPYQPRQKKQRLPTQTEVAMAEQQTQEIEVGGSAAGQQTVTVQAASAPVAASVQQAPAQSAQPAQVIQLPPPPAAPRAVKPGTPVAPGTPIATVHGQVVTQAAPMPMAAPARGARRLNVGVGADGLPVGGKFKFSRKANGMDPGMVPGSLIGFGAPVPASTVSTFPSVDEWIQLNLLNSPAMQRLAGTDVTIVVERLDDRGQPMRPPEEFYYTVPGQPMPQQPGWGMQPGMYPGMYPGYPGAGPMQGNFAQGFAAGQQQQPQPQSANERLLDFLVKQNDDLQKQARELAYPKDGRPDATAMMMAMNMQQQSAEIARKVEETRAQIASERSRPQQRFGGGFGGLNGLGAQQQGQGFGEGSPFGGGGFRPPMMPPMIADDSKDAMAELAKTVIEKSFDKPAAAAAPDPLAHPLVAQMFTAMMAPKQQGPDPVLMEMLRESRERSAKLEERLERVTERLTSPDKTSEMDKAMGMIDKLMVLREKVEPPQSTPGFTDVLMNFVNQLPEIMPSLASMAVKPPTLTLPPQQQQQQTAPAQPAMPPLPDAAKAGLYALRDSAGMPLTTPKEVQAADQATVNALFAVIKALMPIKAWLPVAEAFGNEFTAANSRGEVEMVVRRALASVGARGLANNAVVVTRATDALHRNYTQLYGMLNKGAAPKAMPDAGLTVVKVSGVPSAGNGAQPAPKPAPRPSERQGPPPELINDGDAVVITQRSMQGNFAPKSEQSQPAAEPAKVTVEQAPAVPAADPTLITV